MTLSLVESCSGSLGPMTTRDSSPSHLLESTRAYTSDGSLVESSSGLLGTKGPSDP